MLFSRQDYADKMSGKAHVELQVVLYDSVRVCVGAGEAHVQLPDAEQPWTLLQIKQHLRDFHGIDWACDSQTSCRFTGPTLSGQPQDDAAATLQPGVIVTLVPPPRSWVENFPLLLIQPFKPPAVVKKAKGCLVVIVSSDGEANREIEVTSNVASTVAELKALLQHDHGIAWAVVSSKCLNETSKVLKDEAPVPATGRLKLRRT
jgi:hypothetical protein